MSVVDSSPGIAGPAMRRALPTPKITVPAVSVPTVLLFLGGLAVWGTGSWLAVTGTAPMLLVLPLHALVTFTMFTVVHESAHHAAGKLTWLNELLGRLAMLFVAAYAAFPTLRFIHGEHHRNTNSDSHADPDSWTTHGSRWQLPLRWLTVDLWYMRFYATRMRTRPSAERAEAVVMLVVTVAGVALATAFGHGTEVVLLYLLPQRLGLALLAWWFDWLPHHGLPAAGARGRFGAARVRVGMEWLFTPIMLAQNYHLVHHLHPAVPFYRYPQAWRDNREAYLARDVPITTAWGRELNPAEYRELRRLAGPAEPEPGPPAVPAWPSRFHPLRVAEVRPLTADAVAITLEVPPQLRETFRFLPGQHVAVRATVAGRTVRRTYSVCSPAGSATLRIAVKRRDGGAFSTYATHSLRPGDVLDVLPPTGGFTLTPDPARTAHYVALAAGSGITPVLSIVDSVLTAEPHSRVTLLYVNTSGATTLFAAELRELARKFEGRLHVVHYRTDERDPDLHTHRPMRHFDTVGEALAISHERYQRGRLDGTRLRALLQNRLHPAKVDEWFLCGPRGLLELTRRTLAEHDVPDEVVHFELFRGAPRGRDPVGGAPARLTVTLGGVTSSMIADAGETVLEAGLRAGLEVPYSCTGGACGTCRARLVRGQVGMDVAYALTEADAAEGWILTCRARPATPDLTVDYDG